MLGEALGAVAALQQKGLATCSIRRARQSSGVQRDGIEAFLAKVTAI
jgi:hypothetical protein